MSTKQIRRVLGGEFTRPGWTWTLTNGSHIKGTHTSGGVIFTGGTPSDQRVVKNLKAQLRRAERIKSS